jgi:hypothetical protein
MNPLRILPALLLLGACGSAAPRPAAEPENPQFAECRQEARGATSFADFARQANPSNPNQMDRIRAERAEAEQRAFRDCLRRRGLVRGGGVEPVRRPGMF